jgi:hypothetical protein
VSTIIRDGKTLPKVAIIAPGIPATLVPTKEAAFNEQNTFNIKNVY